MSEQPVDLQHRVDEEAPLGELLRSRALASSPPMLLGQTLAGAALNAVICLWHPDRWGIAVVGAAAVGLHALWSLAVLRTTHSPSPASDLDESERPNRAGWWRVRRVAAIAGSASALLLLWSVSAMLLGRWIS